MLADREPARDEPTGKGSIDLDPGGASVNGVIVDRPVADDWSHVFATFGLSAEKFSLVDGTVRCSTWQQSRRTESGDRDLVQLYAYSARFTRKSEALLSDEDVEAHRDHTRRWKMPKAPKRTASDDTPCAAVINLADIQGGKSEGGGVAATSQRLTDGLENVQRWIDRVRQYRNLTEVVLVNNGDPLEGCAGSYASQMFTVELNTRGQMNFVLDHWSLYAKALYPQFARGQFVSVLCNHGQLGRMGGPKNQTSDSDNAGGFLAETLQRVLSARPEFDHVKFTVPHDEMTVYPTVAGIPMGFNHGHQVPGHDASGFEKWLNGQVRGDAGAHAARIWVTAHRHHFQCWDFGSATGFQCPSLDGGSKWLRDLTGRYARSGILAFVVGEHDRMGWSDMAFL